MTDSTIDRANQRLNMARLDAEVTTRIRGALEAQRAPFDSESDRAAPKNAYLNSVTVAGFRGIGPEAKLEIQPGPGLTLVVGRNGSGKSSFADALEFLVTGDAMRWSKRTADWKKGWRNLHDGRQTTIRAEFLVAGESGPLVLQHTWNENDALDGGSGWAQPHGRARRQLGEFAWLTASATARPFLSYSELGTMLELGPSKLYDAMSKILGLDALVEAAETLRQDRLARQKAIKATEAELEDRIRPQLQGSEDPRAARCAAALSGSVWDLDTVVGILGGDLGTDAGTEVKILRSTAALSVGTPEDVEQLATEAREAVDSRSVLAGTDAHRAASLADLLKRAVRFHTTHAEPDCPVCGTAGVLDDAWREQATSSIEQLETQAAAVRTADSRVAEAFRAFRAASAPAALDIEGLSAVGIDTAEASRAIDNLADVLDGADGPQFLDEVRSVYTSYAAEMGRLQMAAGAEADRRDDAWRPIALELSGWLTRGHQARRDEIAIAELHKAEKWIQSVAAEIRRERFEPIAAQAQAVWAQLSLHSNVELRDLMLSGATTTRKLNIDVAVDGVKGVALGVMSQGELHGLALSLFLPRASIDESPFRFVVIDDPVQAMDPSRVDGLARVLADVARNRQVVVFTHDDRLPEAVRRLQIPTTILDVTRRPGSVVEIHRSLDPVEQALSDARALARSDGVPEEARRRLVPGICRIALEAAATAVVRRRRLESGRSHQEVERDLLEAQRLSHYLSLALFDVSNRGGEVLARLNQYGHWAADAYQTCNKGTHGGYEGDLAQLVTDVTSLAGRIEALK